MVKLVEEAAGDGELLLKSRVLGQVRYRIKVFQGMFANGMPNPAERTIEGSLDGSGLVDLMGARLTLQLSDGRRMGITICDETGKIETRPACMTGCSCC
jgi:hypothetical protein